MLDGVFSFLKPPGITSHDAVAIVRRLLGEKKVGHSGTLDPLAMGVLPMFVGRATRLIEYTESHEKTYIAEGRFGYFTDTEDSTGQPLSTETSLANGVAPTWEALQAACATMVGMQQQQPSMYSAIKVNGQRAYELARQGKEVVLPSREITIMEVTLLAYAYPYFTVRVTCSAGTYIRALLRDIFKGLGCAGHMTQLTRTKVGDFYLGDSITGEELTERGTAVLLPADQAIGHLPKLEVTAEQTLALQQGKRLSRRDFSVITEQLYRTYGPQGFFSIVKAEDKGLRVIKNIYV